MTQYRTSGERLKALLGGRMSWLDALLLGGFAVAALVLGLVFFTAFLALFSVLALVAWARSLWVRRRLKQAPHPRVIEGEYRIIHRHERD
jgi:hypothetical protein